MCLTCDIITGKTIPVGGIIFKNDQVVLHHCVDVNIAGYLIISPVRHIEACSDLNEFEILKFGTLAQAAAAVLREINGVEKIYLANFGEETAHFHMHIFPRYKWMVDCYAADVGSGTNLDGAKLLSICRQKHRIGQGFMETADILDAVNHVRNRLAIREV